MQKECVITNRQAKQHLEKLDWIKGRLIIQNSNTDLKNSFVSNLKDKSYITSHLNTCRNLQCGCVSSLRLIEEEIEFVDAIFELEEKKYK